MTTFRVAIKAGQQGIAYLILDNGLDYMQAMSDALNENKFQLFLTLIQKTADDAIVQKKNDKGQTLMHILAMNSDNQSNQSAIINRISSTLQQRGVNCICEDNSGNNPLHYAVKKGFFDLVKFLIDAGANVNQINSDGHSPLSIAHVSKLPVSIYGWDNLNTVMGSLLKAGADTNIVYPEKNLKE